MRHKCSWCWIILQGLLNSYVKGANLSSKHKEKNSTSGTGLTVERKGRQKDYVHMIAEE